MKIAACHILILIAVHILNQGYAQPPEAFKRFQHIDVENGYSHTDATCVQADEKGFIWSGSYSGLNRFDGYVNRVFYNQTDAKKVAYVNRITQFDIAGHLIYMATEGGLTIFNRETLTYIPAVAADTLTASIIAQPISRLAISKNKIYFINAKNQLGFFEKNGDQHLAFKGWLTRNGQQSFTLASDEQQNIYAGLSNAFLLLPAGGKQSLMFSLTEKTATDNSVAVLPQADGKIFLSHSNNICQLNNAFLQRATQAGYQQRTLTAGVDYSVICEVPVSSLPVSNMVIAPDESLYIGTFGGLYHWNTNTKKLLRYVQGEDKESSLSSNLISGLAIDASSCLWISTFGGSINQISLKQNPFYLLKHDKDLPNTLSGSYVRALAEAPDGNIIIGTRNNGINIFNRNSGSIQKINRENTPALISNNIRSLHFDKENRLWIGTDIGLMYRTADGTITSLAQKGKKLIGQNVFDISGDVYGNVWAGTWDGGLNQIKFVNNEIVVTHIPVRRRDGEFGTSSNRITFIYTDERPEVWVANDRGLDQFLLNSSGNIYKVRSYTGNTKQGFSSNFVWPVVRLSDSTLYVGTLGGGLNELRLHDNATYSIRYVQDSSAKELRDVESMLIDDEGNLWLGGKSLAHYNTSRRHFEHYDVNDGLQGNSFKIGSSLKTSDGWLFFGGINGLSYFDPKTIKPVTGAAQVVFTGLDINGKPWKAGADFTPEKSITYLDQLRLSPQETNLRIYFSAMQHANPQGVRYRYKLDGFDKDWRYSEGLNNVAAYDQLDYGSYTFLVETSLGNGTWNAKPTGLKLYVKAPFYKSTPAKIIYILLILLIGYLVFLYQGRWFRLKKTLEIKTIEEQQKESLHQMKLQFFTNISHEFRTPLTLILGPVEKLLHSANTHESQKGYLRLVYSNARRLLGLINELMDFRKAESERMTLAVSEGNLSEFTYAIASEFKELAANKNLEFEIQDPTPTSAGWFDKNLVEKMMVNVLSNAFKHTSSGIVSVKVYSPGTVVFPQQLAHHHVAAPVSLAMHYICVSDAGRGIAASQLNEIFDRYFTVDTTAEHVPGTGVGLALVKSLVQLHKGEIRVYSELGKGTSFYIGLPLNKKAYAQKEFSDGEKHMVDFESLHYTIDSLDEEQSSASALTIESIIQDDSTSNTSLNTGRKKLLVVEDNAEMRRFLQESLQEEFDVLEAASAELAIDLAKEQMPDAIVSDFMLPGMNGSQLCKLVRSDLSISHTPFILITAKASVETHLDGVESGADVYFPKPFSIRLLLAAIKNLFESRSRLKATYAQDVFAETRQLVNNQRDKEFLDELIALIEKHMESEELDVELICRKIGMSRTKLYGKIKSVTGQPVGEFIRSLRLKKAARMLVGENKTILEVMYSVGIQSQSYFTKAFKKEFGKTPSQFVTDFDKQQDHQIADN